MFTWFGSASLHHQVWAKSRVCAPPSLSAYMCLCQIFVPLPFYVLFSASSTLFSPVPLSLFLSACLSIYLLFTFLFLTFPHPLKADPFMPAIGLLIYLVLWLTVSLPSSLPSIHPPSILPSLPYSLLPFAVSICYLSLHSLSVF